MAAALQWLVHAIQWLCHGGGNSARARVRYSAPVWLLRGSTASCGHSEHAQRLSTVAVGLWWLVHMDQLLLMVAIVGEAMWVTLSIKSARNKLQRFADGF